ncbi:MAG TPA: glycosyltransferase [Nitrososphaeraceae archaeon]|nr:glycosyltransferase [Nitrososphaeraceae archaeon]
MVTISYALCVFNEILELERLLAQIFQYIRKEDEIVVLFDNQNGTKEVRDYLDKINVECEFQKINFHRIFHPLNGNFAEHKNFLKQHCKNDVIVQIDADEIFHENLIQNLPLLLEVNDADLIIIPRENYVNGITQEDINKWGWRIDEKGRINYFDGQQRIIRNKPEINWVNNVHEQIVGYKSVSQLPHDVEGWCLIHIKDIERQRRQNLFYENL